MDFIEQMQLLSIVVTVAYGVIIAQAIVLRRILASRAWTFLAAAFVVGGARQLWGFIRLPAAILRAREFTNTAGQSSVPSAFTLEQCITIGAGFVMIGLFIAGLDRLRRDLRKIGV